MVELDDATRRALLSRNTPPAELDARVLARLRVQLAGPPEGGSSLDEPPLAVESVGSGSSWFAYAAKVVAATLVLTGGGLALVAIVGRTLVDDRPSRDRDVPVEVGIDHESRPRAERETSPAAIDYADAIAEPEPVTEPLVRPPAAPAPADEPDDPGNTLQAELALLRAAREAESPTDALVHLDQHRREFATGVLADEREALRIEALCALDRREESRDAKQEFLTERPSSPLRPRVIEACR
jgi:hypothetical protein